MATGWIYALVDAREPHSYRYVGQTTNSLCGRLTGHLKAARNPERHRRHSTAWVVSVLRAGSRVIIIELEEVDVEKIIIREAQWIAALREAGYKLTNALDGEFAGARSGWKFTEESRVKVRQAARKRRIDYAGMLCVVCGSLFSGWPYGRRHITKTCSPACRKELLSAISKTRTRSELSEEHRAKLSQATQLASQRRSKDHYTKAWETRRKPCLPK